MNLKETGRFLLMQDWV